MSDFKTVNIWGTKYCQTLEELQDFVCSNLPTSIMDPPNFSAVEMGYLESVHGTKGRKVWLCDDAKMESKGKTFLLWCYTGASEKKPHKQSEGRKSS